MMNTFAYLTVNFVCNFAHERDEDAKSPRVCYSYSYIDGGCVTITWICLWTLTAVCETEVYS